MKDGKVIPILFEGTEYKNCRVILKKKTVSHGKSAFIYAG
jgi:hypothetical protein